MREIRCLERTIMLAVHCIRHLSLVSIEPCSSTTNACALSNQHLLFDCFHVQPYLPGCVCVCISGDIAAENVRGKGLQREMDSVINDLQNVL